MALVNGYLNGYNAYNIPPAGDLKVKAPDNVQAPVAPVTPEAPAKAEPEEARKMDLTVEEVPERQNASIENVAISFGVYDSSSIEMFGDRGLASEDMKQAISGMQRDKILHEYQYFVGKDMTGKDRNIIVNTEDGMVIKL